MAGSVTVVHYPPWGGVPIGMIVATCSGDAADGSFPATVLPTFGGFLNAIQTNPGPASTDVTLAASQATDDIIHTAAPHGYTAGTPVRFKTLTGGTGLSVNTTYYVSATSLGATTFRVSAAATPDVPFDFSADITAGTVTKDMFDAPTDNYDIALVDADGLDRLGGVGANRDVTNSERLAVTGSPAVNAKETALSLQITNNSVVRAVIVVTLYYTTAL
jgi:hypothetical protein